MLATSPPVSIASITKILLARSVWDLFTASLINQKILLVVISTVDKSIAVRDD
jgi:hypothetical protein